MARIKSSIFFSTVRSPDARPNATAIVRGALAASGVDLVASCSAEAYDARAPEPLRTGAWLPGARGVVVAASAGPALWRRFYAHMSASRGEPGKPDPWAEADPLDRFVSGTLFGGDAALAAAGVRFRRFEAAVGATPRIDFVAVGRLVGLGSPGPFGMLIHPVHGPWWALRGAWLVDAEVDVATDSRPPCAGCAAPCVGGWSRAGGIALATPETRRRCVVGPSSRYDEDQIAYHHDREATVARMRGG